LYKRLKILNMSNKKNTSNNVATTAAKILSDSKSSTQAKQLAGSALSQVNKGNETSPKMEKIASRVLDNPNSSTIAKKLAGSVLSQSNK
jgi:hypothetical protein